MTSVGFVKATETDLQWSMKAKMWMRAQTTYPLRKTVPIDWADSYLWQRSRHFIHIVSTDELILLRLKWPMRIQLSGKMPIASPIQLPLAWQDSDHWSPPRVDGAMDRGGTTERIVPLKENMKRARTAFKVGERLLRGPMRNHEDSFWLLFSDLAYEGSKLGGGLYRRLPLSPRASGTALPGVSAWQPRDGWKHCDKKKDFPSNIDHWSAKWKT